MDEDPPIKFFFEKKNLHNSKRERERERSYCTSKYTYTKAYRQCLE